MDIQAVIDALSDLESLEGSGSEWESSGEESGVSSGEDQELVEDQSPVESEESDEGPSTSRRPGATGKQKGTRKGKGKGKKKSEPEYPWDEVHTVRTPPARTYSLTPGPCLPQGCDFDDAQDFACFFSDEVFEHMVEETNVYAHLLRDNRPLTARSRLKNWRDVDITEMKAFIGLILNMGIIKVPTLQEYWSTDITTHIPFFTQVRKSQ